MSFYRHTLGLPQLADWSSENGKVVPLSAGIATLELFAAPVDTPWGDRNPRVRAPDGIQLTLFTSHPEDVSSQCD